ncbi:MAG: hypothetical protein RR101_09595 [Burkholderiaceae bacterium]
MKRSLLALAMLALSGVVPQVMAQTQVMPIAADADAEQIEAKILAVDVPNRLVTLETVNGPTVIHVSDKVKNLAQVKAGDTLRITYNLAVATMLKRGGAPIRSNVQAQSGGQVTQKGAVIAGAGMTEDVITANVTAVDAAKNRITVQGPAGRIVSMKLQEPGLAAQVKVGDQLEVAYRLAMAVQVLPGAMR